MEKKWKHPRLGEFTHDGLEWVRKMTVPTFAAFSYDTGYSTARRSTGKIQLGLSRLLANGHEGEPTPGMIAVAEKILGDPSRIVRMVAEAFWEDFNGRGPDSGMWWHGNIKQIHAEFDALKLPRPEHAGDLLKVLRLYAISVYDEDSEVPEPHAYLYFDAGFEEGGHGVSLLTNGDRILGTGYASDLARPWDKPRKRLPKNQNPFK